MYSELFFCMAPKHQWVFLQARDSAVSTISTYQCSSPETGVAYDAHIEQANPVMQPSLQNPDATKEKEAKN